MAENALLDAEDTDKLTNLMAKWFTDNNYGDDKTKWPAQHLLPALKMPEQYFYSIHSTKIQFHSDTVVKCWRFFTTWLRQNGDELCTGLLEVNRS